MLSTRAIRVPIVRAEAGEALGVLQSHRPADFKEVPQGNSPAE